MRINPSGTIIAAIDMPEVYKVFQLIFPKNILDFKKLTRPAMWHDPGTMEVGKNYTVLAPRFAIMGNTYT